MRKKKTATIMVASALAGLFSISAFAGAWQSDANGWWWQNDDGTYPVSSWQWLDGNNDGISECYYFNENGYMLADTTTPDGYIVNSDGAWIVNGAIQTQQAQQTQQPQNEAEAIPDVSGTYIGDGITCSIVNEGNSNYWVELSGLEKGYLPDYIGNGVFEIAGYIRYTFSGNSLTVEYPSFGEVYHLTKQ